MCRWCTHLQTMCRMMYPPADDVLDDIPDMSSASQISNEISLLCYPHVVCTSSARHLHETSVPRLFQVKQQRTALLKISIYIVFTLYLGVQWAAVIINSCENNGSTTTMPTYREKKNDVAVIKKLLKGYRILSFSFMSGKLIYMSDIKCCSQLYSWISQLWKLKTASSKIRKSREYHVNRSRKVMGCLKENILVTWKLELELEICHMIFI